MVEGHHDVRSCTKGSQHQEVDSLCSRGLWRVKDTCQGNQSSRKNFISKLKTQKFTNTKCLWLSTLKQYFHLSFSGLSQTVVVFNTTKQGGVWWWGTFPLKCQAIKHPNNRGLEKNLIFHSAANWMLHEQLRYDPKIPNSTKKYTKDNLRLKQQKQQEDYIHTTKREGRKILQHIIQTINHFHNHSQSINEWLRKLPIPSNRQQDRDNEQE